MSIDYWLGLRCRTSPYIKSGSSFGVAAKKKGNVIDLIFFAGIFLLQVVFGLCSILRWSLVRWLLVTVQLVDRALQPGLKNKTDKVVVFNQMY